MIHVLLMKTVLAFIKVSHLMWAGTHGTVSKHITAPLTQYKGTSLIRNAPPPRTNIGP